ncbi:hypothetical protein HCH_01161 [Hahella chejuensis KCTC 2396]|uniref:Uncharacterized protein n=1 Tax=Hahella chejuensis (strain KCTC 2396) TaxID=349521 RepID=Q2SMT6_HAHCH|nr:hypothetical protein HCH_01161 [Hahella chejuensis KCTC 2396]
MTIDGKYFLFIRVSRLQPLAQAAQNLSEAIPDDIVKRDFSYCYRWNSGDF